MAAVIGAHHGGYAVDALLASAGPSSPSGGARVALSCAGAKDRSQLVRALKACPSLAAAGWAAGRRRRKRQAHSLRHRVRLQRQAEKGSAWADEGATLGDKVPLELRSYDPKAFSEYFGRRPLQVLARFGEIAFRGGCWAADFSRASSDEAEGKRLASDLKAVLTDLGPSFVKLGQVLSSRVDLLPREYIAELRCLTDRVPPFPTEVAREILREDLPFSAEAQVLIRLLPSAPVASASIGQVYRVVGAGGEGADGTISDLAVKVQRPGVREQICLDLLILRSLAPWAALILQPNTDLLALVDEYGERFVDELDYCREAEAAENFQTAVNKAGLESVFSPQPLHSLTRGRVLVTNWVDGERIDVGQSSESMRLIGIALIAYLFMLLETGSLHADPHPGNLLRTTDGRLCILDWGLVTKVDPQKQRAIITYIVHLLAEDYAAVPQDLVRLGFIAERGVRAMEDDAAVRAIAAIFRSLASGGAARRRVGDILPDVQEVRRRYGNIGQIPAYFAYILRAFSVLEGIGLEQNPEYSIAAACYPYLASWMLRQDGPLLQEILEALLYRPSPVEGANGHPTLSAKRLLKLLDAFEAYARQTQSPSLRGQDAAGPAKVFWRLAKLPSMQRVIALEAARSADALLRELLEALAPPGLFVGPERTAEDRAVLAALEELAAGLLDRFERGRVGAEGRDFFQAMTAAWPELAGRLLADGPAAAEAAFEELAASSPELAAGAQLTFATFLGRAATRLERFEPGRRST